MRYPRESDPDLMTAIRSLGKAAKRVTDDELNRTNACGQRARAKRCSARDAACADDRPSAAVAGAPREPSSGTSRFGGSAGPVRVVLLGMSRSAAQLLRRYEKCTQLVRRMRRQNPWAT
jgi:hypothetical protein